LYWADRRGDGSENPYPATAPVLSSSGQVEMGVQPGNVFPICVPLPSDPQQKTMADSYLAANPVGGPGGPVTPYCPDAWLKDPKNALIQTNTTDAMGNSVHLYPDADAWAARGAINAGMAVFLYLDQLERGNVTPPIQYNHCEQLSPAK
jgi:hypothetical protein